MFQGLGASSLRFAGNPVAVLIHEAMVWPPSLVVDRVATAMEAVPGKVEDFSRKDGGDGAGGVPRGGFEPPWPWPPSAQQHEHYAPMKLEVPAHLACVKRPNVHVWIQDMK